MIFDGKSFLSVKHFWTDINGGYKLVASQSATGPDPDINVAKNVLLYDKKV